MTLALGLVEGNELDLPDVPSAGIVVARTIKDPIHAMVPITPRLASFIDTKQFQRLRSIKQLGTSYYVWLGASHNRFEHCIGVAYLARLMATHLQKNQPELEITDRDVECVEIAGLCHDLGHGPWSHVWDGLFIPQAKGSKWKHEDGSEMMFEYMIKDNDISLSGKDKSFIKALIAGEPSQCIADEKPFLFDIVANKRNGLDVDKFDYILRDSRGIGDPMSIALPRIIQSARVLDNQICYDIKDANQIYDICSMRFKLHKIVYNHKAAKAIEYMIIDGLLAAEPILKIAERVFQPERYLHLTDNIMPQIEADPNPELAPARAIFERIRNRDLYKMVDYKVVDWPLIDFFKGFMTADRIVDEAKKIHDTGVDAGALTAHDVIVDFSVMHYGMKEKNPLDFVKFYSKRNPNQGYSASRGDYSNLMPTYHAELLVRIFTKAAEYVGIVQAGYRACLTEMPNHAPPEFLPADDFVALTPPATEAPSTPRPTSRVPSFNLGVSGSTGATAFTNNNFTTVAKNFVPTSPSRKTRAKRQRDVSGENEASELKKRKV
ncbi:hypothetical protein BDZ94DRAFT_233579 [Collybia nuda]|uniref:HD/PDEase domain-containing protein n=1 Tax=Collybia nuda TaxID=64659 RepID=A0A9P6C9J5_9AGAR|nr:hypothetical protein BDZ94DRAFT_233579 [Collybia nuda]